MGQKTIFQKIIDREVPAAIAYEDEQCIAIKDHTPQAPVHVLIIPKRPIARLSDAQSQDESLLGHLLYVASKLSQQWNLGKGFRIVINNGPDGGETVPHLHMHLLAGKPMSWPPWP